MPYIVIAYALATLTWQAIAGTPPPWTDWFASHLLLIALAVLYLGQSRRLAACNGLIRWRSVPAGQGQGWPARAAEKETRANF
jgi:hypothetical protein